MTGTLYGVGLGPGDPDLITLKAARLIESAAVIAYPTLAGGDSFARAIASGLISENVHEIRMDVPMTTDRAPAQAAYDQGAAEIAAILDQDQDDPFTIGRQIHRRSRARRNIRDRLRCRVWPPFGCPQRTPNRIARPDG